MESVIVSILLSLACLRLMFGINIRMERRRDRELNRGQPGLGV